MRKVIISKRASTRLNLLFEYLEQNWSTKVKNEFIDKLDKSINLITIHPETCEESSLRKGLRKCVVTKQTTLFYKFDSKTIKIVTLFDNRMNPDELKKEI